MKKSFLLKNSFCLGLLFALGYFSCAQAFEKKNELPLSQNQNFYESLEKPFYLFGNDKDDAIPFYLKEFIDWDHRMINNPDYSSEAEDPFFEYKNNFSEKPYLELIQTYNQKLHNQKKSTIYIKENKTKEFLKLISKKIDKEPSSAKFKFENDQLKTLSKSELGLELKIDESYQKLKNILQEDPSDSYIPLETTKIEPEFSEKNTADYQIKKLVGSGKSDFTGSTKTRIYNIKTAAKQFNGVLLKPDEEFSFTSTLGEVDESTGYKEELVIKKNQTVPEYGGGICQLSTTFFRAALNTGLKITERHNHSYPVHYYTPIGTDATVYVPSPDLKIKNNLNQYVLIQTKIDEAKKKFYVEFYAKEKIFEIEIIGPKITKKTPEGKIRTTLQQVVRDQNGQELFQDIFKSFYDNPANYPSPSQITREKPADWSNRQWGEYYAKFGSIIEDMRKED